MGLRQEIARPPKGHTMRFIAALGLALGLCLGQLAAEEVVATGASLRFTPIVRAVQKTMPSVVTIRVPRPKSKDVIGTGVIFHEDGYVVTNSHVVDNKPHVDVRLNDGTELVGEVWTNEPRWDLAVVKIKTKSKLSALPFGTTSDLMLGETVIAIGHPYGYSESVTNGIVSAKGRDIKMPSGHTIRGLIQVNAGINKGNSGGPLLNIDGDLIGITVAVHDGAQGIAFAINADTVRTVVSKHLPYQRVAGRLIPLAVESVAATTPATSGAGVGVPTGGSR
jgi:serine protease Do